MLVSMLISTMLTGAIRGCRIKPVFARLQSPRIETEGTNSCRVTVLLPHRSYIRGPETIAGSSRQLSQLMWSEILFCENQCRNRLFKCLCESKQYHFSFRVSVERPLARCAQRNLSERNFPCFNAVQHATATSAGQTIERLIQTPNWTKTTQQH